MQTLAEATSVFKVSKPTKKTRKEIGKERLQKLEESAKDGVLWGAKNREDIYDLVGMGDATTGAKVAWFYRMVKLGIITEVLQDFDEHSKRPNYLYYFKPKTIKPDEKRVVNKQPPTEVPKPLEEVEPISPAAESSNVKQIPVNIDFPLGKDLTTSFTININLKGVA